MSGSFPQLPDLIAHRGNAAEYPENTLPALRSALELGAQHVEFDVQLSADHCPFLLHDADLKRTAGLDRQALDMIWSELAEISVNESERLQGRYTDVGIPSLAQTVSLLETFPNATAFVELKRASLRKFGQDLFVNRVCNALKPVARQCVIISFDLPAIHHVRKVSDMRIGWVTADYSTLSALKCEALAPDFVFCDHELLTENTARLWRGPWRWAIYEVTSRKLALELAARGASYIETMAVRSMLREFRGIKTAERR
jgi:glycerophosphoryl diester phosphodiesterase